MAKKLDQATMDEIKRKAYAGESLTNPSAEKQYYYDSFKNEMNQANKPTWDADKYANAKPPSYESAYGGQMNDLMNQIMNKPDFSYDATTDPMYAQYKEMYNREGDRAMKNNMAEAANLTGGRTNSWAVSAGQQAQDYYNQKLNDKVPELQMMAYQMYNDKYNQMGNQLSMLQQADQLEYQKYMDNYNMWQDDYNREYGQYMDQLNNFNNDRNYNYQQMLDKYNMMYQGERDNLADDRYNKEWDYNTAWKDKEWENMLSQQGLAQSNWEKEFGFKQQQAAIDNAYRQQSLASRSSGGSKSSSSKSSSTKNPYTNQQLISQASKMLSMEDDLLNSKYSDGDIIDWVIANAGNEQQAAEVLNYLNIDEPKKQTQNTSNPMRKPPQFIDPKTTASFFRK